MRYDMAGGAAVLGAMRAIAQLKPSIPVTALIPTVENMPGSRAQRPGDIVTSLSGKTVEVLNTDAEGRLILIDALTYAQRLGCTHLVDAATLTGAVVVALGHLYAGAFTNNQPFLDKLLAAAKTEGEKMWQLPLDEEYKESPEERVRRSAQHRRPSRRSDHRRHVHPGFRRRYALGPPGHRRHGLARRRQAFMAKAPPGIGVRTFVQLAESW